MCGIAAIYADDHSVEAATLRRMNAIQRHRGPDGAALWLSANGNVGLGHTRLAIVGLENGEQPLSNEDGSIHVVVNGEFYDHATTRNELIARGHRFGSDSDSEIALHLYEEYGIGFAQRLRGEFALILWDERRQALHAVRDRFGIKPLFYTRCGRRLLFASEIKALLRAGKDARWDYESFWSYIHFSVLPDRTWFDAIRQVPPGHILSLAEGGGLSMSRYWDISYPREAPDPAFNEQEFLDEFAATFHDCVRLRMQADVAVGAQLSGGADSTAVVAAASRCTDALQTFTVRFPGTLYDEGATVAQTVAELDVRNSSVVYRDTDLFELLHQAGFHAEWIQENSHGIARFILGRAIHDSGLKVVLAGEGGDELFGGYAHFHQDLAHTLSIQAGTAHTDSPARGERHPFSSWQASVGHVPTWMKHRYHEMTQWILPLLSQDFTMAMRERDPCAEFLERGVAQHLRELTPFHQSLYTFNKTRLPNYILAAERLDMAHAVEVRLPYLDHRLFECVNRMPLWLYCKNGKEKYVLRQALQRMMRTVHLGAKQPFLAPPRMQREAAQSYRYFLEQIVASDVMADQPFFSRRKLQDALRDVRRWLPGRGESAEAIWQIVIGVWLIQAQFVRS